MGSSISIPNFKESFSAKLNEYQNYLRKLGGCIYSINENLKDVSNELFECIERKEWYDDTAVAFSKWWNPDVGDSGRKALMNIYENISNIYTVTGTKLSYALAYTNDSTNGRTKDYALITKVANGERCGFEELKWENLKKIVINESDSDVNIDAEKINRRLKNIQHQFQTITDEMERIRHLVAYYFTDRGEKAAINFKDGFDYASILRMQREVGEYLTLIQTNLADNLKKNINYSEKSKANLKNLFNADFTIKK